MVSSGSEKNERASLECSSSRDSRSACTRNTNATRRWRSAVVLNAWWPERNRTTGTRMVARPGMDQVAQPPVVGLVQFEERTVAIWLEVLALRTLAPPAPDYLARRGTPAAPR